MIKDLSEILTNPDHITADLILKDNHLQCLATGQIFHIRPNGMIDFINHEEIISCQPKSDNPNLIFRLNEFYNHKLEQKISTSIFAVGGINSFWIKNKILQWLSNINGNLLDVGCGDKKWQKYSPSSCNYIALDYLPAASSCPWRESHPDINADAMKLPIKTDTIDAVINIAVLEHVKSPPILIKELARVLKPGGFLLLLGPGDICMSHGEPDNYFNITRYGYYMLLKENNMEIIEEYFPIKSFMSIANLIYMKIVRNDFYNNHPLLKILQLFIFILSIFISPFINILALILDFIIPFDKRAYSGFMVLAKKKEY